MALGIGYKSIHNLHYILGMHVEILKVGAFLF